jgi:hypothetical protein
MQGLSQRTGGRAVEGARLESVYTFIAYRGFESPSVRHTAQGKPFEYGLFFMRIWVRESYEG